MRVTFFHAYPHQYAGAQRVTHALAHELRARGHEAVVVVPDDGPFADVLRSHEIPVRVVSAPASWRIYARGLQGRKAAAALAALPWYWLRLRATFRELGADLVHINDHRGMLLAGVPAALARKPVVWHLHGPYESRAITALGRLVARRIVVVSEATRSEQPGLAQLNGKVAVVPNGVIGLTGGGAAVEANGQRPLVVTGARFHPDKGLDVLIRAAASLRRRHPGLRVVVAGLVQPGYEAHEQELRDLVGRLDLGGTVSFAGLVDEPLELWRAADVYVQPSRREPFGLGVIEAMSVGTPVVATSVGGMRDLVDPWRTGLQVRPDDVDALAAALSRVLSDRALASSLAAAGREHAAEFTLDRFVDRMLAVYRQAAR